MVRSSIVVEIVGVALVLCSMLMEGTDARISCATGVILVAIAMVLMNQEKDK